ncbi:hypothetical protein B0E53_03069 [Micromonospora sp. MH33]|nr:hypothetical protein B0E53_03069 [Micromonospora sp. MH33]
MSGAFTATRSPGRLPAYTVCSNASARCAAAPCDTRTGRGVPVEPEVKITYAGSAGAGPAGGGPPAATRSSTVTVAGSPAPTTSSAPTARSPASTTVNELAKPTSAVTTPASTGCSRPAMLSPSPAVPFTERTDVAR